MIDEILIDSIENSGFLRVSSNNCISVFSKIDEDAKRFLMLLYADDVMNVDELHQLVLEKVPEQLSQDSAYKKNTDLIVIVKFDKLDDFRRKEKSIFAIEENSYFFKKYVLYYTHEEENLLRSKKFDDLRKVIVDKGEFLNYKNNPTVPSFYAIAARIFIKLPFLELVVNENDLISLGVRAKETVSNLGAERLNGLISATADDDLDIVIGELIKNEMENIKA